MKHLLLTFTLILVFPAIAAFAADISGVWKARIPACPGLQARTLCFKFNAGPKKLTGVITGLQENEIAISEGQVSGHNISFHVDINSRGGAVRLRCLGKLSGDSIVFLMRQGDRNPEMFTAHKICRGQL